MAAAPTGPKHYDCADCGKAIGNKPRVTIIGYRPGEKTRVVCEECFAKTQEAK